MNDIARLICLLGLLTLSGCGSAADHSHADGAAEHTHDGDAHDPGGTHDHDGGGGHDHGDDSHTHEASETDAFYGDDASSADAMAAPDAAGQIAKEADAGSEEMHSHVDGEPHAHEH